MKKNGATAKEISPKGVANLKSKDCNLIDAMLYTMYSNMYSNDVI